MKSWFWYFIQYNMVKEVARLYSSRTIPELIDRERRPIRLEGGRFYSFRFCVVVMAFSISRSIHRDTNSRCDGLFQLTVIQER
jgi:hypothetical protein